MTEQQKTAKQRLTRAESIARGRPKFVITDPEKIRALVQSRRAQIEEARALAKEKKAKEAPSDANKVEGPGGGQTQ